MDQATNLRQKVQESNESSNARVIAVTSGKGGVGKTSLSVNLAMEMAKLGKKVSEFGKLGKGHSFSPFSLIML